MKVVVINQFKSYESPKNNFNED